MSPLLVVLSLHGRSPGGFYSPFSSQETLNVELVATWSDGDTSTVGESVAARDGFVYLAMDGGGLSVIDGRWPGDSDLSEIMRIDSLRFRAVAVKDSFMFAMTLNTSWNAFVDAFDIRFPESPVLISRCQIPLKHNENGKDGYSAYLSLGDDLLFLTTSGYSGPYIVNISNPYSIFYASTGYFSARQVAFTPPCYLYTASWGAIYIIDVSDPSNPVCVDSFGLGNGWECVETEGDLLAATAGNVAYLYDISEPLRPKLVAYGLVGDWVLDILMRRNGEGRRLLYIGEMDEFEAIDVTDGSNPVLLGRITQLPNDPTTLFWDRGYVYISDGTGEDLPDLWILHYTGDSIVPRDSSSGENDHIIWLRTVYSRPGLEFCLSQEAEVSFWLFNAVGQRVYGEELGVLEAGPHRIKLWGPEPGIYFLILNTDNQKIIKKLVFTKPQG